MMNFKKQTIFIYISISLFNSILIGCSKYEISPSEKAVNKVMARNSKMLANKYHMKPIGISVSMPGGDIRSLELEFKIYGPLSKDEIRAILIGAAHDFLADINSDSELCSYLKNHALSINDIGIVLYFIDVSGRDLDDPNIGIAEISKGELRYSVLVTIHDTVINKDIPQFKSTYKESYKEALNILNF